MEGGGSESGISSGKEPKSSISGRMSLSKTRRNGDALVWLLFSPEAVECELIQLSDAGLKGYRAIGVAAAGDFQESAELRKAVPTRLCAC